MHASSTPSEQILIAVREDTAFFKVLLRGSYRNSSGLKQAGASLMEQGVNRYVLDMHACHGMDSTFMGVLAGLAFKLKKAGEGEIILVGLTARTRGLLATLGLDRLVTACMEGETPPDIRDALDALGDLDTLEEGDIDAGEKAQMILEAHENLVDVTPDNLPKFKDVLMFLREDVKKATGSSEP